MARLALLSVAIAALVVVNAQRPQPMRSVMEALNQYYESRKEYEGRTGGDLSYFDWEQEQRLRGDRRYTLDSLASSIENLEIRMFMDRIRSSSLAYSHICPKLMGLLERGFMRSWLVSYFQRSGRDEEGGRRNGREDWRTGFARFLRRRGDREGRGEGRGERGWEEGRGEGRGERGWEEGRGEGRGERGWEEGRGEGREGRGEGRAWEEEVRTERTWREGGEPLEVARYATTDAFSPQWQGLIASCYVYQDIVHGDAPRLDNFSRPRNAAAAQQ